MKISDMNWMQVEEYLKRDDRCVLPLGSTEQHAYLSLSVDSILAERMGLESAAPLEIPVFPVLAYGITPYFRAYPGSVTLRVQTYLSVVRDVLDGLLEQGFKRILIVNGHGGNSPAQGFAGEWMADFSRLRLLEPKKLREYLNEGNYGGLYQRPDADMHALWAVAVAETRELLEQGWV